jgi:glycosyltransferase involved in cell wall biosynthesis
MNRSEINNLLSEIREKCNKDNADEYLISIQDIFQIKPVTMLFFNVKAKLLCEIGKYEEAAELLTFTINLCILEEEYVETCKIFQRAYKAMGKDTLHKQWSAMEFYIRYTLKKDENSYKKIETLENNLVEIQEKFINVLNDCEIELKLANSYYESWYSVEGTIMYALSLKKMNLQYKDSEFFKDRIAFEVNHTFLLEQLLYKNDTYVILSSKEDYMRSMTIAKALTMLNKNVYVILPAVSAKVEYEVDLNETVKISIDNIEVDCHGIKKVRPIEIVLEGEVIANNIALLIDNLTKETEEDFSIVLGAAQIFTCINDMPEARKRMQRLSQFRGDLLEGGFAFGYFGSYTSYISKIYSLDVKEEINKQSEYEFSIVIPVRNSAESLRYTLQTCLEQRGMEDNSYEIVVSDNSNPDYMEVENLVKEIKDRRIKYYRTPRSLPLAKSFEYAFIKAKGEFIFSIGADDAVLPWGLEVLRKVLMEIPEDDVIQWDRGFFVWPNNSGMKAQSGQFVIPRAYNRSNVKIVRNNSMEQLMLMLNNPSCMYGLPMLYINSGVRRRYFNKLIKDTGRLWDGMSQDAYMGIANLMIYETIPHLQYPITIAGMTGNSIGLTETNAEYNIKSNLNRIVSNSNFGGAVTYGRGLEFITINVDICLIYSEFYRLLNTVLNEKFELICKGMNLKHIFNNVAMKCNLSDLRHDYYMKSLKYSAYRNSYEMAKWFDDNLLQHILQPKTIIRNEQKTYIEGFLPNGGLQLDANKFNIVNIYEATKLFKNICNL